MNHDVKGNYVRTHRKRCGLSQRELALLIGYKNQWQVSRHEGGGSSPTLRTALAYEALFRVPVSTIFNGMQSTVARSIERKINALETRLRQQSSVGGPVRTFAKQLQWLESRNK